MGGWVNFFNSNYTRPILQLFWKTKVLQLRTMLSNVNNNSISKNSHICNVIMSIISASVEIIVLLSLITSNIYIILFNEKILKSENDRRKFNWFAVEKPYIVDEKWYELKNERYNNNSYNNGYKSVHFQSSKAFNSRYFPQFLPNYAVEYIAMGDLYCMWPRINPLQMCAPTERKVARLCRVY